VGGHGGEGRVSVVTSCQSAEPSLLNVAFAFAGFGEASLWETAIVNSTPRTFSAGLLVNTGRPKECAIGECISTLSTWSLVAHKWSWSIGGSGCKICKWPRIRPIMHPSLADAAPELVCYEEGQNLDGGSYTFSAQWIL